MDKKIRPIRASDKTVIEMCGFCKDGEAQYVLEVSVDPLLFLRDGDTESAYAQLGLCKTCYVQGGLDEQIDLVVKGMAMEALNKDQEGPLPA